MTGRNGVDGASYRDAMARLGSAVHLVTTDGDAGRAGFTASAVCSVSDTPPSLLVCINRMSSAYAAFSGNEALCVNTLGASQLYVADAFSGGRPMEERFACATWQRLATGAAVLPGALASFDCRIVNRVPMGTHDVLFCEVVSLVDNPDEDGLVYARRRYHNLSQADPHVAAARPPSAP
jgi:flavin reductase